MNFEPNIYGVVPPPISGRVVESYESLLERYPWFNAARRLTRKIGDVLPANIILSNYFRPPQDRFHISDFRIDNNFEISLSGTPPPIPRTEAERLAVEAIARREVQRAKRADADESDFPTTSGISAILGSDNDGSEQKSDDIIAAFVSGGEYRIDFSQNSLVPEPFTAPLPTPDTDPTLRVVMEFLAMEDYHIDPNEEAPTPDKERFEGILNLSTSGFATEELGAIYLRQNLLSEAQEIYCELSLQNPEKSGYFATLIAEAQERLKAKKAKKTRGLKR